MESKGALDARNARPKAKPRILVADDEEPVLAFLEMKFSMAGFEVVTARDGREAWNKATQDPVDVVITDYRMPDIDGVELCTKLLLSPKTRDIPVLVITSPWCKIAGQLQQVRNVVELVEKPLNVRDLVEKVRRLAGHAVTQGNAR